MRNKRRYGGYIVHLGMLLIFVGITGSSAFQREEVAVLKPGQSLQLNGYTLQYTQLVDRSNSHAQVVASEIEVMKSDQHIATMYPSKEFHPNHDPVSEVAIRQTMKEDLYLILVSWDEEHNVSIKALVIPLVAWIWMGGIVMIVGVLIALGPDQIQRKSRVLAITTGEIQQREVEYA